MDLKRCKDCDILDEREYCSRLDIHPVHIYDWDIEKDSCTKFEPKKKSKDFVIKIDEIIKLMNEVRDEL